MSIDQDQSLPDLFDSPCVAAACLVATSNPSVTVGFTAVKSIEVVDLIDSPQLTETTPKCTEKSINSKAESMPQIENGSCEPATAFNFNDAETPQLKNNRNVGGKQLEIVSYESSTPCNFSDLETPQLKNELASYGIRPLARKKAVTILKQIYKDTHPIMDLVTNKYEFQTPKKIAAVVSIRNKRTKKLASGKAKKVTTSNSVDSTEASVVMPSTSGAISTASKLYSNRKIQLNKATVQCVKVPVNEMASKTTSEDEDPESDTNDPDDMALDNESEAVDLKSGKRLSIEEQLKRIDLLLRTDSFAAWRDMFLTYEPVKLQELQEHLRKEGLRCSPNTLIQFLDSKCFVFSLPGNAQNRRRRCRKPKSKKVNNTNAYLTSLV